MINKKVIWKRAEQEDIANQRTKDGSNEKW